MKALDVGIDLDGCAYNFTASVRKWAIKEGYDAEQVSGGDHEDENTTWNFFKDQWGMDAEEFFGLCARGVDAGVVFLEGEPFPGSVETITALKSKGHYIHIVTNRQSGTRSKHNTADWLNEWQIPYDSLIFSDRKHLFSSLDIMVDDYEINFRDLWSAGVECWLYDRPWNRHVYDDGYRVKTWGEFESMVDRKAVEI